MKSRKLLIGFAVAALVGALALVGCGSNAANNKEAVTEIELGGSLPAVQLSEIGKDTQYYAAAISSAQEEDGLIARLKTDSKDAPDIDVYRWPKVESEEGITDLAEYAVYDAGDDEIEVMKSTFYNVKAPCYAYVEIEKTGSKTTSTASYIMEDGEDFVAVYVHYKDVVDITL